MYEYIKGVFEDQGTDYIVLETGGIGYKIFITAAALRELPGRGNNLKIYIHPAYKEDDLTLYGFLNEDERAMFRTLTAISGIGPKAGMGLLSTFTADELIGHIAGENATAIAKAPGIGKKTASRIVLELKDKYKDLASNLTGGGAVENLRAADNQFNEAVNAMLALGYSYNEASQLVEQAARPEMGVEEMIKAALLGANPLR